MHKPIQKRRLFSLLLNFPLGVLCGAILSLAMAWLIDATTNPTIEKIVTQNFGSIVAFITASIALVGVAANIENQNSLKDEEYRRRYRARIASLSIIIADCNEKAKEGILLLSQQICRDNLWPDHEFPHFSPDSLRVFRELIELARTKTQKFTSTSF
ncbi:hypothetical protein DKT77_09540 [Meridianimarinicoccus roseus]|uniref:Uncharacterized protein n=1 Tax=Meridianimarinicoccus roseus TaxID=2072018 RepID=A0A2V2LBD6_9RHOB|nr:hypothetical protein [Meridianimarinicoccus roseus]PWR02810.1 hypothetical protein DKT77_09540 [Meridianimarinicoccus roseus]